jgi:hypothetical protein
VINSIASVDARMLEMVPRTQEDRAFMATAHERGGSAIYAPGGAALAGPVAGGEQIVYADADLERIVPRKIHMDYTGNYNRFDIFQLSVHGAQRATIALTDRAEALPELEKPRLLEQRPESDISAEPSAQGR